MRGGAADGFYKDQIKELSRANVRADYDRRFPSPWTVEEFEAKIAALERMVGRQALAYVYFDDVPQRRAINTTAMSRTRLSVAV
jgi:hypothetical protein